MQFILHSSSVGLFCAVTHQHNTVIIDSYFVSLEITRQEFEITLFHLKVRNTTIQLYFFKELNI